MNKARSRAVLVGGRPYQKKADGTLVPLTGKTDWKRLDRQTPAQTDAIAMKDRDGRPMTDEEWARAEIVQPRKVAVGIKRGKNFDEDVTLEFAEGPKGVTIDSANPVIKHGDTEAKLTFKATDDASLGDFTVKVTGHPTKGSDASNDFKITVAKK